MGNKIWRWIKKGFVLEISMAVIGLILLSILGITVSGLSVDTFDDWFIQNSLLIIIVFLTIHLTIKGWLMEKINDWVK